MPTKIQVAILGSTGFVGIELVKILSKHPNVIKLLKDRIEYEKSLTYAQFNRLENKINWLSLSINPNAIDLLKNNKDKINWEYFSTNPAIFKAV